MFLLLFNHSGTGSYMSFYYDLNDAGTYFDVDSQNPITHIENYWCPLKIFGDFWDFYFLGQPIYWTYKQPLCCYKMTE